jgi:metal-responsive CopG/Arc/MetJ family transcriptional regulator
MPSRQVRISIDTQLLQRVDQDPETREKGRSAFIRSAVDAYLSAEERRQLEACLVRAYSGHADALLAEMEDFLEGQSRVARPPGIRPPPKPSGGRSTMRSSPSTSRR